MIRKKLNKSLSKIEDLVRLNKYSEAIKLIVSTYELSFKALYHDYLGRVNDPSPYFTYLQKQGIKDVRKCMFGKWIGFLSATDYFDNVYFYLNKERPNNKKEFLAHLNIINSIRISETHQSEQSSFDEDFARKEITKDAENHLILFLKKFSLIGEDNMAVLNKFDTVNIQKLNGEVQLYESLFEVLTDGRITNLDVTYFAQKIPKKSEDEAIGEYWTRTNEMIEEGSLCLRRIVTTDEYDVKGIKLLWILFSMIPSLFDQLGKQVNLSLFKTSNIMAGNNSVQEAVCLQNMILMYSKRNPDKGHVWLFPGHQTGNQEQEYIHLYGSSNIMLFQKIYNNMYNSSLSLDAENIKGLLLERKKNLDAGNIVDFIDAVYAKRSELELEDLDLNKIKSVYHDIFNDNKTKNDDIW